jgi:dTDP-4-dehydrorhamnose reductase
MHILITGAGGFLGSVTLHHALSLPGTTVTALRSGAQRTSLSLATNEIALDEALSLEHLAGALQKSPPSHILHIGALSSPEACEKDPVTAERSNVTTTKLLCEYANLIGAHITLVSTDLIFGGAKASAEGFKPEDPPCPSSVYSDSKLRAERLVLESSRGAVARVSLIYGHSPSPMKGVLGWIERSFRESTPVPLFYDEFRTPIHVNDATIALLSIAQLNLVGIWHCGGPDRLSRVEFGEKIAHALGYDATLIKPTTRQDPAIRPARPEDVSLDSRKLIQSTGRAPRDVTSALRTYRKWC